MKLFKLNTTIHRSPEDSISFLQEIESALDNTWSRYTELLLILFALGYKQSEIAEVCHVSRQAIQDSINNALKRIREAKKLYPLYSETYSDILKRKANKKLDKS